MAPTKGVERVPILSAADWIRYRELFKRYYECIAMSSRTVLWKTDPANTGVHLKFFSLSSDDAQDRKVIHKMGEEKCYSRSCI